jgi:quercetin dioxygenase-like cupin family protein
VTEAEVEMRDTGAVHVPTGTGPSFYGPGDTYTFIVTGAQTGGTMFAIDCLLGAGGGPPPHRHLAEDELFVIHEGRISFTAEGETRVVQPGDSVFVPRGTAHFYVNDGGATARMLAVYTPAGMEGWFREVCTPVTDPTQPPPPVTPELIARMLEAGPRHNVEWITPDGG